MAPDEKNNQFNGTLKNNLVKPVRFIISSKIKPKSKDAVIRLEKFKVHKKNKLMNSEITSPTKESDLFDVTFN